MTSTLSLPVVELEKGDGGEPDVAEAAVPGMGAHAHFDPLVRERGRQHLHRARICKAQESIPSLVSRYDKPI